MKSYSFDTDDAVNYGVDEAIILHNFKYWISHNIANKQNLHDGKTWTYNSFSALQEIFPFFTYKQIRRIIKSLLDQEVIITGNYNKKGYDRTTWYSLTDEKSLLHNMCPNGHIHLPKRAHSSAQTGTPIPDIKPDIKQVQKTLSGKPDYRQQRETIILYLNNKAGFRFKPHAQLTKKHIDARLSEGKSIEDFMTVIDSKFSEWWGNKMQRNIRPQTLFGTKFDDYLGSAHIPLPEKPLNGVQILTNSIGENNESRRDNHGDRQFIVGNQRDVGIKTISFTAGEDASIEEEMGKESNPFYS
jgi:uncharacterized phage protein (TIGR02220 family)